MGHDGEELSESEFNKMLEFDRSEGRWTEFGAAHPPVILASLEKGQN